MYKNVHQPDKASGSTYYENSGFDLNTILSNLKPLEGRMLLNAGPVEKEFYQENEWRIVPIHKEVPPWATKDVYENEAENIRLNNLSKEHCSLKLSPSDIKYLFVKTDSDIPDMINFIQTKLDHYSSVDLKILMSRVVSLESISSDL